MQIGPYLHLQEAVAIVIASRKLSSSTNPSVRHHADLLHAGLTDRNREILYMMVDRIVMYPRIYPAFVMNKSWKLDVRQCLYDIDIHLFLLSTRDHNPSRHFYLQVGV